MSDWNESSRIRKDFRHSHDGPEVPRGYRAVSADKKRKKKSKNLCRGGKAHDVHLVTNGWYWFARCSVCHAHEYNLPLEALAQVYPRARTYLEYKELCYEEGGHSYKTVELKRWWRIKVKVCEVCGYTPRWHSWETLDIVE